MEVTRQNFEELLPEIEKRLKSCNFVSIDAEYTGLHPQDVNDKNSLFDTPDMRYTKLRDKVCSKFQICQIGLAFFERSLENQREHHVNAYNFYVFPVSFDSYAKREILSAQVSCINFLTKNNFDFNKFYKEGVPYLSKEKVESLRRYLDVNRHFMNTCEFLDPTYFPNKIEFLSNADIDKIVNRLEGFSKIVRLLQQSKKPIVGHNMLMDILLLYNQFIQELPVSYTEFKESVHELFPNIFDTKCIAWGIGFLRQNEDPDDRILSDTNLFALYTNVSALLQSTIKPLLLTQNDTFVYQDALVKGITTNLETVKNAKCHCAAFDATVTGGVFLKLGYLATRPRSVPEFQQQPPPTFSEIFKRLSSWKDEVNIGRCVVSNIHLAKPDPISKRPDWIRVRSIQGQKTVDPVRLRGLLVKYGDIEIDAIKDSEVVVACGGVGCFKKVWKDLQSKGYQLSVIKIPVSSTEKWSSVLKYGGILISVLTGIILYYRKK